MFSVSLALLSNPMKHAHLFLRPLLCIPGWLLTCYQYVAKDKFELLTLLPLPFKCWNDRCVPPHPPHSVTFNVRRVAFKPESEDSIVCLRQGHLK